MFLSDCSQGSFFLSLDYPPVARAMWLALTTGMWEMLSTTAKLRNGYIFTIFLFQRYVEASMEELQENQMEASVVPEWQPGAQVTPSHLNHRTGT